MAGLVELEIEYQRLVAERDALGNRYLAGELNLLPVIKELNARISALVYQIEALLPKNSSGQIVESDQKANQDLSEVQSPTPGQQILKNTQIQPQPDTTTPSNALGRPDSVDTGINAPVRTTVETQGVPPINSGVVNPGPGTAGQVSPGPVRVPGPVGQTLPIPGGTAGVGAANDDSGQVSPGTGAVVLTQPTGTSNVVTSLNAVNWDQKIDAQPNVLDQYASYSYQASLYLMDKNNADRILNTGSRDIGGAKLLIQSGGAPLATRNDFFSLDYYLDNIELKSFFVGKATRLSHNVKEVKMTVVEPNGISFLQNLDAAVQQFIGGQAKTYYENDGTSSVSLPANKLNFTSQIYMLVIRFYGYDEQGNLVKGGKFSNTGGGDPNACVEKFYPLIITKLTFKIASKAVEYEIHAKAPPYYINASQGRGTIPFNFEFSGQTVSDILAGPDVNSAVQKAVSAGSNTTKVTPKVEFTTTYDVEYQSDPATGVAVPIVVANNNPIPVVSAPPKASAVTSKNATVRQGLMTALNQHQQKLYDKQLIQYKDEYNIEFVLDSMGSATVALPGLNKSGTSMSQPTTAADQKLGSKQSMDPATQISGVTAGTQIVQAIDQIIRRSSYIRDQQTQIVNNKTGDVTPGPGASLKDTAWFKIGFKAVPKLNEYDEKRNDYAYKITYTIAPYRITQLNSPYFKQPRYLGVHKAYEYWFTGQNTQVLSYEESLNSLYYIAMTNTNLGGATSSVQGALNVNELLKFYPITASGQATQGGGTDKTMEPQANAADQLYSPSDLKEANITIVGDPAWLQQGEAFVSLAKNSPYYFNAFLPDGTINFDAQQILFSIGFNAPRDYDLLSGVMQPSATKLNSSTQLDKTAQSPSASQISRIYIAKECTSLFKQGKFTQQLKGSLMIYYPPGSTEGRKQPTDPAKTTSAQAAASTTTAKPYVPPRSSVTNPTPTSALAKGTQQILNPPTQLNDPTLSQLQSSPAYILARRGGATPAQALDAARAAFAAGTNNYQGAALPGIRTGLNYQDIVKDQ